MKQKLRWTTVCLTGFLMCGGIAGATTITSLMSGYTWTGEISGPQTDLNLPPSSCAGSCTVLGFTFTDSDNGLSLMPNGLGSGASGITTNDHEIIITTPTGGETAIWLSLGLWDGSGNLRNADTLTVTLSDGESFNSIPTYGTSAPYHPFWFSSSTTITSVTVKPSNPADEPFVRDLVYATSSLPPDNGGGSSAPEAATISLVSGGVLILFGAVRRLRGSQSEL